MFVAAYWLITKYSVPGNDEKWRSQEAKAEIAESQVDGHELRRSELLSLPTVDQQHRAIPEH